ncbi:MAG: biopolymer transporter ExbD [Hahellaceae bacterium]|nr:biopolymer transporter ExbD [Hahellaceae bacterium]MCP5170428.1 biopolymer transporter ExbD [Hahellaceae bacterium]
MRHRFPYFKNDEEDVEINMTPMLDVVFILLIFFIVTTSFIREAGVEVNRPQAQSAAALSNKAVVLAITADNQIWIDHRQVDPRAVRRNIERLLSDNPETSLIIQADQTAQTGVLVNVLDQAKLAGATAIAVAAEQYVGH